MSNDLLVGFFFSKKDLGKIARNQRDLILRASGLSEAYEGKLPASAHLEIPPILKGHFDRRLVILEEVLKSAGLSESAIAAWTQFERAFENVIVR